VREPVTLPFADVARRRAQRPEAGRAVVTDQDVLPRLVLWLADVTAETVLPARVLETDSPLPGATPEREPEPVVPR